MNDTEKNQRKLSIYTSLLLIVVLLVGVSYALFQIFARQSGQNNISTIDCLSVTYEDVSDAISLVNEFPITDNEGYQKSPYTFKVTNNCSEYVGLEVGVETLTTSTVKPQYIKGSINRVGIDPTTAMILSTGKVGEAMNGGTNYIIKRDGLAANESVNYELRLWIDYDTTEAQAGKEWHGKVVVSAVAETAPATWDDPGEGTLMAELKANNEISTPVSVPGKEPSGYTLDDVSTTSSSSTTTTTANYYITYGTGWTANGSTFNLTGTALSPSVYSSFYSNLIGKYLPGSSISASGSPKIYENRYYSCSRFTTSSSCSAYSSCTWRSNKCNGSYRVSTSTIMRKSTTGLNAIYYVVDATSSTITLKELTSNAAVAENNISSTADDYGTSYYFRGKVDNNFVEYANMCWRIVRIAGNGAIKMVLYNYNGLTSTNSTPSRDNPCSVTGDELAFARFEGSTYYTEFNSSNDDNAYVGFMYGTTGANSYNETHANTTASTILTNLNKWYTNVLSKQDGFSEKQLADVIWCNDKSTIKTLASGSLYGTELGYGTNHTGYGAYSRLFGGGVSYVNQYASPSLICPNDHTGGKLSKFTVDDFEYGNGALDNKIGLLTADEVAFAGGKYGVNNPAFYLKENARWAWWLLTPITFDDYAYISYFNALGAIDKSKADNSLGWLRPAIALVPNIEIVSGDGTATNPYKIGM